MIQQVKCANCGMVGPFDLPAAIYVVRVVERGCKKCGVMNSFELHPPKKKTFVLTGKGLEVVLRFAVMATEKYKQEVDANAALGMILHQIDKALGEIKPDNEKDAQNPGK